MRDNSQTSQPIPKSSIDLQRAIYSNAYSLDGEVKNNNASFLEKVIKSLLALIPIAIGIVTLLYAFGYFNIGW